MRLQKQLSKRVGKKEYAKWVVVIPPRVIAELGWKDKEELKPELQGKKLILEKN